VAVRTIRIVAVSLAILTSGGAACSQESLLHPDPTGWVFGVRAVAGASHDDTGFDTEPPGVTDTHEDSYDPQENFGAGAFAGYQWSAWGVPLRAELSGTWMYRHDADMVATMGAARRNYQNNLSIWDVRLSLLADVLHFSWGRVQVGGGLGAALLDSEVEIENAGETADNDEWKLSPSLQAGMTFDDVFRSVDLELAYRFRWFGDTESGVFSDGTQLHYDNVHIHEVMLGLVIPLGQ
jgi:hypothetical protein